MSAIDIAQMVKETTDAHMASFKAGHDAGYKLGYHEGLKKGLEEAIEIMRAPKEKLP
jgi:flagellar biosynthesis/type III secretory pathway protein FliH